MADEFRVELTADNEISDEARDAAKALDQIPESVESRIEVEASGVDKAIDKLDVLAQEAASSAIAAETLGQALGPELSGRADMRSVIAELEKLGITADEVTANVDRVAAKLREVDSADLGGPLGQSLGTARGETEKLADSARGANSALANMIGNSAQELGAFSGLAGGAGVAIGQMGEYAADAALGGEKLSSALGSMAKVAGPIAGIALIIQGISSVMGAYKNQAEQAAEIEAFNVENAELFGTLAREARDIVEGYVDKAREAGKIEVAPDAAQETKALEALAGEGERLYDVLQRMRADGGIPDLGEDELVNITDLLDKAGSNAEEFYRAASSSEGMAGFIANVKASNLPLGEQAQLLAGVYYQQQQYATGAADAEKDLRIFGKANEEAAESVDEVGVNAEAVVEALRQYALAAVTAQREVNALGSTFDQLGVRGDAISSLFDLGNAPLDAAGEVRDVAIAIGELSEAAKGVTLEDIQVGNIDADPLLDELDALRPQIQGKITEAFSAGGPEAATAMANSYIDQVTAELGGKLPREEVARLLGLENIEATVQVALDLSAVENARRQLEILTGITGETPYTASIALALDAGTITGEQAQTLIQAQLAGAGVEVPATLAAPTTDSAVAAASAALNAGEPVSIPGRVDLTEAETAVAEFSAGLEASGGTVTVDADTGTAETGVDDLVTSTEAEKPVVEVNSNISKARDEILLIRLIAALLPAVVNVTANTGPAESAITHAARDRGTTVHVGTSGVGAVDSTLNSLTRDRTVTIRPNVVPTSVLVRVDGGG